MDLSKLQLQGSEDYALKLEEEEKVRHSTFDSFITESAAKVRHLFEVNDDICRKELVSIFNDPDFIRLCMMDQDFVNYFLLMDVYREECHRGESVTILDLCKGIDEMEDLITDLKYLFFRLEFTDGENDDLFAGSILNKGISKTALVVLTEKMSLDVYGIYRKLAEIFLDREKLSYTLAMLMACDEKKPGLEENLILMAQIYMIAGDKDGAKKCLDRIENPSHEVEEIYAQLRG
ncbi:MAG: hypothetical protein K6D96_04130 [Acetatifactor sp.]|nr:hypothetical protein [Acetatifactor sp.]